MTMMVTMLLTMTLTMVMAMSMECASRQLERRRAPTKSCSTMLRCADPGQWHRQAGNHHHCHHIVVIKSNDEDDETPTIGMYLKLNQSPTENESLHLPAD